MTKVSAAIQRFQARASAARHQTLFMRKFEAALLVCGLQRGSANQNIYQCTDVLTLAWSRAAVTFVPPQMA